MVAIPIADAQTGTQYWTVSSSGGGCQPMRLSFGPLACERDHVAPSRKADGLADRDARRGAAVVRHMLCIQFWDSAVVERAGNRKLDYRRSGRALWLRLLGCGRVARAARLPGASGSGKAGQAIGRDCSVTETL